MEVWQLLEVKKAVLGAETRPGLLDDALEEIAKVNVKKWKRARIVFEFEFDERGELKTAVEVRQRRPWD